MAQFRNHCFLILKMMQKRENGHKFRHNSGLFGVYMCWVYPWTTKSGKWRFMRQITWNKLFFDCIMGHGCTQIHAIMKKPCNWNMVSTKVLPQKNIPKNPSILKKTHGKNKCGCWNSDLNENTSLFLRGFLEVSPCKTSHRKRWRNSLKLLFPTPERWFL